MPTVYHLALMAEDVYAHDDSGIYAASFHDPAPAGLPDAASLKRLADMADKGFAAAVYETDNTATITYRGTETTAAPVPEADASDDVPPQFARALDFAQDAIQQHGLAPDTTFLCGHSLGGALTKYVAHHLARQGWRAAAAVSFNGPGLTVSMLDRVLIAGMSHLTEASPVGDGVRAVHRLIQQVDVPMRNKTDARLVNINLEGDIVSKIGEAAGVTYTLTAPEFVVPPGFQLRHGPPLPEDAGATRLLLREVYLHSMHTLRRVLADDPLGRRQVADLPDTTPA